MDDLNLWRLGLSPILIPRICPVTKHSSSFANRVVTALPTALVKALIRSSLDFYNGTLASLCLQLPFPWTYRTHWFRTFLSRTLVGPWHSDSSVLFISYHFLPVQTWPLFSSRLYTPWGLSWNSVCSEMFIPLIPAHYILLSFKGPHQCHHPQEVLPIYPN